MEVSLITFLQYVLPPPSLVSVVAPYYLYLTDKWPLIFLISFSTLPLWKESRLLFLILFFVLTFQMCVWHFKCVCKYVVTRTTIFSVVCFSWRICFHFKCKQHTLNSILSVTFLLYFLGSNATQISLNPIQVFTESDSFCNPRAEEPSLLKKKSCYERHFLFPKGEAYNISWSRLSIYISQWIFKKFILAVTDNFKFSFWKEHSSIIQRRKLIFVNYFQKNLSHTCC